VHRDKSGIYIRGHVKIYDPLDNTVLVDKDNSIHYENMSISLAESIGNEGQGPVYKMAFGNGGSIVDSSGVITYLTPNNSGINADLYNRTYEKVIDDQDVNNNTDVANNKIEIRHVNGTNYTDLFVTCLLDYGEMSGQDAFDTSSSNDGTFVFDELGLVSRGTERLLTHVIFHPVQKSLNRLVQIDYTVRIQTLSAFNEV